MITRKPPEIPASVARAFVRAMKKYLAETDLVKRDAIAAEQMSALRLYQPPHEKKLRLEDIKQLFNRMKDVT